MPPLTGGLPIACPQSLRPAKPNRQEFAVSGPCNSGRSGHQVNDRGALRLPRSRFGSLSSRRAPGIAGRLEQAEVGAVALAFQVIDADKRRPASSARTPARPPVMIARPVSLPCPAIAAPRTKLETPGQEPAVSSAVVMSWIACCSAGLMPCPSSRWASATLLATVSTKRR